MLYNKPVDTLQCSCGCLTALLWIICSKTVDYLQIAENREVPLDEAGCLWAKRLPFAIEVESFLDFVFCGCLVDADVADVAQEGEVDGGADVFLVVVHEFQDTGIVVAGDGHATVVLADEGNGLTHLVDREAGFNAAEVELDDETVGYGLAVKDGTALQCQRLEGMASGMSEVEGFADAVFCGVFQHDALLDGDALF